MPGSTAGAWPLAVAAGALLLVGCGALSGTASTEAERQSHCRQTGGWWRPNELLGGYCEYQSAGFE